MTRGERMVRLLVHVYVHGSVSTGEGARLLGADPRLVRRDLRALERIAPIRPVGEGRARRFEVDGEPNLGVLDRISLLVGREVTRFLEGTSLHRGIERLRGLEGVDEALQGRVRYLAEPARIYGPRDDLVDACLDGLLRARALAIAYEKGTGGTQRFDRFEPLLLVVYRRALYLVGRLGRRTYALAVDRMAEVDVGEAFVRPEDWDPDAWLAGRFGLTARDEEEPQDVVLRFSPAVAHLVRARVWHTDQRVVELPGGTVLLLMRARGQELVRFALEWGRHCEVQGPAWLRDAVIGELRDALAQYGPEAPP
jgi:proteasome accessory factor B